MRFDDWAQRIGSAVVEAHPECTVHKRAADVYRWRRAASECQLHALNDCYASLTALVRENSWPRVMRAADCVPISGETCAHIAQEIIRWLARDDRVMPAGR